MYSFIFTIGNICFHHEIRSPKIFNTPEQLGEFVISSAVITNTEKELENKIGMLISEWRDVCKYAISDPAKSEAFKDILQKKLSEVY